MRVETDQVLYLPLAPYNTHLRHERFTTKHQKQTINHDSKIGKDGEPSFPPSLSLHGTRAPLTPGPKYPSLSNQPPLIIEIHALEEALDALVVPGNLVACTAVSNKIPSLS